MCIPGKATELREHKTVNTPELEDTVGVMTSTYEYHSVPDPEVMDARDYKHSPGGVLLEVLVLNS